MLAPEIVARFRGRVFVQTGAGISVASGIKTFRGEDGLYKGLNPYDLASPEAFFNQPDVVWNWYLMRVRGAMGCEPNAGHFALAELEKVAAEVTLITSNVDPLHERAGSTNPLRLHGDIMQTRCTGCGAIAALRPEKYPEEVDEETLPTCETCGGVLRPNVVWFGESPWPEAISAVRDSLPKAHVFLEVGTSGAVSYGLDQIAARFRIPVVRVNPDGAPGEGVIEVREPAELFLPALVAALR